MSEIMPYIEFCNIFNDTIFEKSKQKLIEKVAEYPQRYVGLFRPTKPKAKLLQNLLQSHEIRFGDALEEVIERYFELMNYRGMEKNIQNSNNKDLRLDQLFHSESSGKLFFIEQKVRDDHDSSKKSGQINNFEEKLSILIENYDEDEIISFFYFVDPSLQKNKNYYNEQLKRISNAYGVEIHLMYGGELFEFFDHTEVWNEMINHLEKWKEHIPELPEINFDLSSEESFNEIKDISPRYFRLFFSNETVCEQILPVIFPENKTLELLFKHFEDLGKQKKIYQTLADMVKSRIAVTVK